MCSFPNWNWRKYLCDYIMCISVSENISAVCDSYLHHYDPFEQKLSYPILLLNHWYATGHIRTKCVDIDKLSLRAIQNAEIPKSNVILLCFPILVVREHLLSHDTILKVACEEYRDSSAFAVKIIVFFLVISIVFILPWESLTLNIFLHFCQLTTLKRHQQMYLLIPHGQHQSCWWLKR